MIFEHWAVTWSGRCYAVLLTLYPFEFRIRFRSEMFQVFQDCCTEELKTGGFAGMIGLWIRALIDLAISISRERARAVLNPRDFHARTAGLIDSVVILTIIAFHLFTAGIGIAFYIPHNYESAGGFLVMSTTMGAALGGLGVICSLVLARFRRVHYRLIQL
jgi:hypothetical protein